MQETLTHMKLVDKILMGYKGKLLVKVKGHEDYLVQFQNIDFLHVICRLLRNHTKSMCNYLILDVLNVHWLVQHILFWT